MLDEVNQEESLMEKSEEISRQKLYLSRLYNLCHKLPFYLLIITNRYTLWVIKNGKKIYSHKMNRRFLVNTQNFGIHHNVTIMQCLTL